MYNNLAILALFAFLFSMIAGRVERSWVTGPIVFIGFGLLFFVQQGCPYCEQQAKILEIFQQRHGWEIKAIDTRLLDLAHAVGESLRDRGPFHVISGYRSQKTNALLRAGGKGGAQFQGRGAVPLSRFPKSTRRRDDEQARGRCSQGCPWRNGYRAGMWIR